MSGIRRSPADQKKLNDAFQRIQNKFKINLPPIGTMSIPDGVDSLYSEIDFNLQSRLDTASILEMQDGFRYQQADFLLDQAADLFERALRTRADYDDLRTAGFKTVLDVLQFNLLDQIHMNESDAGFYNLDAADSHAENVANAGLNAHYNDAFLGLMGSGVGEVLGLAQSLEQVDEIQKRVGLAIRMGFLPSAPLYDKDVPGHDNNLVYAQWPPDPRKPDPNEEADKVITLADVAEATERNSLSDRVAEYKVQADSLVALKDAALARMPAKQLRDDYDSKAGGDTGFQVERTLVARSVNEIKSIEMSNAGGALNYSERLTSLSGHFVRDVEAALARIMAASDGLKKLFGYQIPLPGAVNLIQQRVPVPDDPERRLVDECVEWTRNAIDFLVRFRQLDQNYALPLSLRSLMQIPNGQPLPIDSGPLPFTVPESLFVDAARLIDDRNVRLRGVSAFVIETGDVAGLWEVVLRVPPQAFCRLHPSNVPPGGPVINQLDQSDVPPCRIATVERRTSQREPAIVGAAALFNVSPLSSGGAQWTAVIKPVPGSGADPSKLADVFAVLHVAVRSAIGAAPARDLKQFSKSTQMPSAISSRGKVYTT